MLVAKLSGGDGLCKWAVASGTAVDERVAAIDVHPDGSVTLAGVGNQVGFPGCRPESDPLQAAVLAKLDGQGSCVYNRVTGGPTELLAVADDPATGCSYAAGYATSAPSFGDGPLPYFGGRDVVVAAFDENGAHRWSKTFGDTADDRAYAVAVGAGGDVLIAGAFYSEAISLGGPQLLNQAAAAGPAIFVARLAAMDGAHVRSEGFSATGSNGDAYAVAFRAGAGNVAIVGDYAGTLDVGHGAEALPSAFNYNGFAASLGPLEP